MNKDPTFLVDMDGTIADIYTPIFERVSDKFGVDIQAEHVKKYDFHDVLPEEVADYIINHEFANSQLYKDVDWLPGAREGVQRLSRMGEIRIVTKPTTGHASSKLRWLHDKGFEEEQLFLCSNKNAIKGDLMVDDCPEYLRMFDGPCIVYDWPWNRDFTGAARAHTWSEVLDYAYSYSTRRVM